jgi:hypothetical protein
MKKKQAEKNNLRFGHDELLEECLKRWGLHQSGNLVSLCKLI